MTNKKRCNDTFSFKEVLAFTKAAPKDTHTWLGCDTGSILMWGTQALTLGPLSKIYPAPAHAGSGAKLILAEHGWTMSRNRYYHLIILSGPWKTLAEKCIALKNLLFDHRS